MEGAWIVLGSGLSTASGLLFYFLSSRNSRTMLALEHTHQLAVENKRQESDRRARQEAALREYLKEQARPLRDFLEIVKRDQGRRLLQNMLKRDGTRKYAEETLGGPIDPAVWQALSDARTALEVIPDDVVKEYTGRIVLIADADLRDKMFRLLGHVAAGTKPWMSESEVSTLILEAETLIAERIVDPSVEPENLGWETHSSSDSNE